MEAHRALGGAQSLFWPDPSATSQLLTDLARHLAHRGHEITVVASRKRYDDASAALVALEMVEGVRVHRVWTTRLGRHWLLGHALDDATFDLAALVAVLRLAHRGDVLPAKTAPPLLSLVAASGAARPPPTATPATVGG